MTASVSRLFMLVNEKEFSKTITPAVVFVKRADVQILLVVALAVKVFAIWYVAVPLAWVNVAAHLFAPL